MCVCVCVCVCVYVCVCVCVYVCVYVCTCVCVCVWVHVYNVDLFHLQRKHFQHLHSVVSHADYFLLILLICIFIALDT